MPEACIESLDHEGRGVARVDGKPHFIEGALAGETVEYRVLRVRPSYAQAELLRVVRERAGRVLPRCPHFGHCGGCSMQHADLGLQVAAKQRILEDALWHIGRVRPARIEAAIRGADWQYRYRARIGVRQLPSHGGVLIGFRARRSSYIADMYSCAILPAQVSALLPQLHELVASLSVADRIPQLELAMGDGSQLILVFRHLRALTDIDQFRLAEFARLQGVRICLQPGGPETIVPLYPDAAPELVYHLPEFDVSLFFRPGDFTQVNPESNRLLVRRALQFLAPQPHERIADLFCGLGNFSLPIGRCGAKVIGLEGSAALTRRASENAARNGLAQHCEFHTVNLFDSSEDSLAILGGLNKMLIDPPREGAVAVVKAISARQQPQRIVYVSCNPATLARDAAILVHQKGYGLRIACIANLFPHTSHVESIALFERERVPNAGA